MIKIDDISKKYGSEELFSHLTAEFEEHKVSCILGASGVGKTTLLNILAGLCLPDSGRVIISSDSEPDGEKRCSYVFQEPRLLPWYNVHDNLDLIARNVRKVHGKNDKQKGIYSKEERDELIKEQLKLVGLENYEYSLLSELSGGMLQRVSLSRAFLYPADILFLDEPFKEQDTKLKNELYETFFREYENDSKRRTVIFVTHDISEAQKLADNIFVLAGRPAEIVGKFSRDEFSDDLKTEIMRLL